MTTIAWQERSGEIRLGLPADLDLALAPPLILNLRRGFTVGDGIEVDGSAVEYVSTACIQALVAASRHAESSGQRFAVTSPSRVLTAACSDLGLDGWLRQWSGREWGRPQWSRT
ncbi:MAG: STAS domain-containing protein [Azospirillum sp.]|nr:STAS domain-containing protein [Azospirillum sp.]